MVQHVSIVKSTYSYWSFNIDSTQDSTFEVFQLYIVETNYQKLQPYNITHHSPFILWALQI